MINTVFLTTLEPMKRLLNVQSIVTVYYFEFSKNYLFAGEQHDFWEMVYVDKGELEVSAGKEGYELKEGDIIFHKPNEFHNLWANGVSAPNVLVVSFVCSSEGMRFFENKIMRLQQVKESFWQKFYKKQKGCLNRN
ncbi:cupin domain-containing protein [Listeria fleischmannii]|uniref:Cupin domain-containing protein n=2 Tax=Listeria fleischmannii TaxID=1069827 RepID=A0A841YBU4_9LIST|nr:AraC family ligand binding domain-containing protein [Listeria fleischmannii]MBC1397657.1 cupin domain-containing protein [Listeria fleischmannii]MBC1426802.1 cupin domain-containing protein [Listeria fleischmannii]